MPLAGPCRLNTILVDDIEGYEVVRVIAQDGAYVRSPAVWRISRDGRGVEVRTYVEDSRRVANVAAEKSGGTRTWTPGTALCPRYQVVQAYHFVAFVRAFGRSFEGVDRVELAADYRGLSGRIIDDPDPLIGSGLERKASIDTRRVRVPWSLEALAGDGTAEATADLLAPVFLLFDGFDEINAASVQAMIRRR